jgi:hypothetical protein
VVSAATDRRQNDRLDYLEWQPLQALVQEMISVSRAKERLYVIGERSVWKQAGAFATLHELLAQ